MYVPRLMKFPWWGWWWSGLSLGNFVNLDKGDGRDWPGTRGHQITVWDYRQSLKDSKRSAGPKLEPQRQQFYHQKKYKTPRKDAHKVYWNMPQQLKSPKIIKVVLSENRFRRNWFWVKSNWTKDAYVKKTKLCFTKKTTTPSAEWGIGADKGSLYVSNN